MAAPHIGKTDETSKYRFNLFMPYCYTNSVGKQMNDYPKAVDEMVDEAFAKSNPTILSAKYFAPQRSKY
jgi:hypothetical protein